MAKAKRGLDGRHHDKSGRIEKKHGNTRIAALRKEYGENFAGGRRKDMMLKTLLKETGSASLHDYLRHHRVGLSAFERVSAVEGLHLTSDMKKAFSALERRGASAAERRAAIIKRYG
jgi:hypothetical protein